MRFTLIDRVVEISPGERIVAVKAVSRAEEYLADHFPTFHVLPGVLMLEALVEAGRHLVWVSRDFDRSMILLKAAKNVTYKSFVTPGKLLRVEVSCRAMTQEHSSFVGRGFCEDREVVKARFTLTHFNLGAQSPENASLDKSLIESARSRWDQLAPTSKVSS